jgi:hypothetical protein
MKNYYLDIKHIDYEYKPLFGKSRQFRDILSIDIYSGKERYFAVFNNFNLKKYWFITDTRYRDKLLKPIYNYLMKICWEICKEDDYYYNYKDLKSLINAFGKSKDVIIMEIENFLYKTSGGDIMKHYPDGYNYYDIPKDAIFYTYDSENSWNLFKSIFDIVGMPYGIHQLSFDLKDIFKIYAEILTEDEIHQLTPGVNYKNDMTVWMSNFHNYILNNEKDEKVINKTVWLSNFHNYILNIGKDEKEINKKNIDDIKRIFGEKIKEDVKNIDSFAENTDISYLCDNGQQLFANYYNGKLTFRFLKNDLPLHYKKYDITHNIIMDCVNDEFVTAVTYNVPPIVTTKPSSIVAVDYDCFNVYKYEIVPEQKTSTTDYYQIEQYVYDALKVFNII